MHSSHFLSNISERVWNLRVPGFGRDEIRAAKALKQTDSVKKVCICAANLILLLLLLLPLLFFFFVFFFSFFFVFFFFGSSSWLYAYLFSFSFSSFLLSQTFYSVLPSFPPSYKKKIASDYSFLCILFLLYSFDFSVFSPSFISPPSNQPSFNTFPCDFFRVGFGCSAKRYESSRSQTQTAGTAKGYAARGWRHHSTSIGSTGHDTVTQCGGCRALRTLSACILIYINVCVWRRERMGINRMCS